MEKRFGFDFSRVVSSSGYSASSQYSIPSPILRNPPAKLARGLAEGPPQQVPNAAAF
jgi:hypothetical protein